jgi:L-erythro-3,5-diaminohexanoate dehydrogenase
MATSPIGLHRVLSPRGVLPQAASKLDNRPEIGANEVRISVERLNLDAASFRQLCAAHDPEGVRQVVLDIVASRGKMQNPVTGSGGMLIGTVAEVGPESPLGLKVGDRVATLVSLTLTPLAITDGLSRWDGRSEQVPCEGHAILFARSIAAVLPSDMDASLALAVLDVCGAPALTARMVSSYAARPASVPLAGGPSTAPAAGPSASSASFAVASAIPAAVFRSAASPAERAALSAASSPFAAASSPAERAAAGAPSSVPVRDQLGPGTGVSVAVIGAAGKSGSLACVAARAAGAARVVGVVPVDHERILLEKAGLADEVVIADARNPVALAAAVGKPADVTVVCVDVPGCEHGAILATAQGGTVIFFSMATSFSAAALGAEGLAADVTMLIGNGYVPGHAEYALNLVRTNPAVRGLFEARLAAD